MIATTFQPASTALPSKSVSHPMKGGGFYGQHSILQSGDIARASEILKSMVSSHWLSSSKKLMFADFGCGSGGNTFQVFSPFIDQLIGNCQSRSVSIVRNDVFANDVNSLASHIDVSRRSRVYELFAPGSFYQRVLPDDCLHVGVCFSSLHWMPSLPSLRVNEHITHEVSAKKYASAYEVHWQCSWRDFLRSRSTELVQDGQLLISFIGKHIGEPIHALFELLYLAMKALVDDGLLIDEQLNRFQIPIHRPRLELDEVISPFEGRKRIDLGLEIQYIESHTVTCPLFDQWVADGDSRKFASRYTNFIRAFSEPTVRAGLFRCHASADDRISIHSDMLNSELYARVELMVNESPRKYELKREQILLALRRN